MTLGGAVLLPARLEDGTSDAWGWVSGYTPLDTLPPDTLSPAYSTPGHPPTAYPSSQKRTWDQRYSTPEKDLVPGLPYPLLWTDKHL